MNKQPAFLLPVEKCQLCLKKKHQFTCNVCVLTGNFSKSSRSLENDDEEGGNNYLSSQQARYCYYIVAWSRAFSVPFLSSFRLSNFFQPSWFNLWCTVAWIPLSSHEHIRSDPASSTTLHQTIESIGNRYSRFFKAWLLIDYLSITANYWLYIDYVSIISRR